MLTPASRVITDEMVEAGLIAFLQWVNDETVDRYTAGLESALRAAFCAMREAEDLASNTNDPIDQR
jgi:hypothetical protein